MFFERYIQNDRGDQSLHFPTSAEIDVLSRIEVVFSSCSIDLIENWHTFNSLYWLKVMLMTNSEKIPLYPDFSWL